MERFFTSDQRKEHDDRVGHQCEWYPKKGQRCEETTNLHADHCDPVYKGGETTEDNMLWLCVRAGHHALKHILDGETWITQYLKPPKDY